MRTWDDETRNNWRFMKSEPTDTRQCPALVASETAQLGRMKARGRLSLDVPCNVFTRASVWSGSAEPTRSVVLYQSLFSLFYDRVITVYLFSLAMKGAFVFVPDSKRNAPRLIRDSRSTRRTASLFCPGEKPPGFWKRFLMNESIPPTCIRTWMYVV